MSQQYQNSPSQAYGPGFGQPYYPSQSPYGQRPPYPPAGYSQQPAHAPPPFQPVPNPSLNLGRFDTNTQTPQPFPFPAGTFPPEMLKQFASVGIPPPPPGFPPMPIPSLNFPQFPPQNAINPSHQQYHQPTQVSDEGADAYDPRFPQSIMHNVRAGSSVIHPTNMTPETARNQTQEGGSASSHTVSHGEYAPEQQPAYSQIQYPSNLDGAAHSTEAQAPALPLTDPRPATLHEEQTPYNAPSSHLSSSGPSSQPLIPADPPSTQQPHMDTKPDHVPQTEYKSKPAAELRSMAKGALLSLAPHGIQFDDLVKEGVHAAVLKELYGELGMKSGPSPSPSITTQPPASNNEKNVDNHAPQNAAASAAGPSLERKDRIAQLLAAKSGRPGPVRSTSGSKLPASTSLADGSSPSASISSGAAQTDGNGQKIEQARTQTPQNQGLPVPSSSSLRISPSLAAQASDTLSSPFTSGIPGLAMMSPDEESHFANRPTKRPLDADAQIPAIESGHKRRNTGLSSKTDGEAMEIDDGSSDEGEVVESPRPSKVLPMPGTTSSTAQVPGANAAQPKPISASAIAKLTPSQMAEKAEMLKAKFLKQRARQKALQDGLPTLDAEVSKTETALAEQRALLDRVRQRIAGLEADLAKARDDEQSLINRIQSSERQLQEGLSGREKYTAELKNLTNEQNPTSRATVQEKGPMATEVTAGAQVPLNQDTAEQQDDVNSPQNSARSDLAPAADVLERSEVRDDIASSKTSLASNSSDGMSEDGETADDAPANDDQSDDEGEYVPEELRDATQLSEEPTQPDAEDSDGSASMSDSGSEMEQDDEDEEGEYEPPEDEPTEPMEIDDGSSVDYEPTDTPIELDVPRQESENVEETEPVRTVLDPDTDSAFATPATELSINGTQNSFQHEVSSAGRQVGPTDSELYRLAPTGPRRGPTRNSAPATPNARMNRSRPPVRPLSNDGQSKSNSFSAYQSPLTSFPAYKFHQQFDDNAKDGYRSLTYSNRIDPAVPLCPTELAGETCEDAQCEEQHFRHLGLNDDKILAQMSSASEFKDKEVRERYVSGLKDTIADLRARDIKAFEEIAKALAKYRREFLAEL